MAWCFHQFTCYIPLSLKDWDLEKFTSSFLSFMVNYNVLDKVWLLLWGDSGQVCPVTCSVRVLEPVQYIQLQVLLVLSAFHIPQYFFLEIIQLDQSRFANTFQTLVFLIAKLVLLSVLPLWRCTGVLRREWKGICWYLTFSSLTLYPNFIVEIKILKFVTKVFLQNYNGSQRFIINIQTFVLVTLNCFKTLSCFTTENATEQFWIPQCRTLNKMNNLLDFIQNIQK